jgi:hypothetical protein
MKQRTIASGNNFGARYWTDGKVDTPMLPVTPHVVVCPHCGKVDWLKNLAEVGEIPGPRGFDVPRPQYDKSFDDLPFLVLPCGDDYLGFLESEELSGELSHDREYYLRWLYWHLMNDSRRRGSEFQPLGIDEVENLQRLLVMQNSDSESSRLTIAEIHRELGDFDACAKMLDYDFSDELIPLAQTIYLLQEEKNSSVHHVYDDDTYIDAWKYRRNIPTEYSELTQPEVSFDPSGPPVFEIQSREWWIKVLGMLQHNWALIEESVDGSATVYFFHDCGATNMPFPSYKMFQLKGRSAIVDSLEFDSLESACKGLRRNDFMPVKEALSGIDTGMRPQGFFYDARSSENGIYSREGNWI